ncbi:MAG: alginate export family protein [Chitinophagaceae bacterium]
MSGQLRTRSEFRDGQGTLLPKGSDPAFFTSQRTRLNMNYSMEGLQFGLSMQDVRVWGQDVSTINRTTTANNNGFMLHQAWAEIALTNPQSVKNKFSLKIGRQEIAYDDQRLLGSLDWLQQGRNHDAALLKYASNAWQLDVGGAYNQNKENTSSTIYNSTPPGNYTASTNAGAMYKSMQFFHANRKLKNGNLAFLVFADQFNKYHTDTVDNVATTTFDKGVWGRVTSGLYLDNTFNGLNVTAAAYYQFGRNQTGKKLSAGLLSMKAIYAFDRVFKSGFGIDYTSGGTHGTTVNVFDPLYGTPHKFWGYMDYFYAANTFGSGGLADYYLKTMFSISKKVSLNADFHQFNSAVKLSGSDINGSKKNLGSELDITGTYNLRKAVTLEAGYSHFFATPLMASTQVKNVSNASLNANWVYIMLNITPEFIF